MRAGKNKRERKRRDRLTFPLYLRFVMYRSTSCVWVELLNGNQSDEENAKTVNSDSVGYERAGFFFAFKHNQSLLLASSIVVVTIQFTIFHFRFWEVFLYKCQDFRRILFCCLCHTNDQTLLTSFLGSL